MTLVEQRPQTNATRKKNRDGELWDAAYERIHREMPSTQSGNWTKVMPEAALFRLIGDLGGVGVRWGVGSGKSTPTAPTAEEVAGTIDEVFRKGCGVGLGPQIEREYTSLPFAEALRNMVGDRSSMQMTRRTGIQHTRMKRLMGRGGEATYPPTGAEMEAIASTFGKAGWYFREYRSTMVAAAVMLMLDDKPEHSAAIAKRFAS